MAHNLVEFNQYYTGVASAVLQDLYLPATPNGAPSVAGRGLYCRAMFSAALAGSNNLGMAEYLFAWHYATASLLSTHALDWRAGLVTATGASILTACVARVTAGGEPIIRWDPSPDLWNWTIRGELWNESAD